MSGMVLISQLLTSAKDGLRSEYRQPLTTKRRPEVGYARDGTHSSAKKSGGTTSRCYVGGTTNIKVTESSTSTTRSMTHGCQVGDATASTSLGRQPDCQFGPPKHKSGCQVGTTQFTRRKPGCQVRTNSISPAVKSGQSPPQTQLWLPSRERRLNPAAQSGQSPHQTLLRLCSRDTHRLNSDCPVGTHNTARLSSGQAPPGPSPEKPPPVNVPKHGGDATATLVVVVAVRDPG